MVEIGRYRELKLTERHGLAEMPEIRAIDLTQDPPPARALAGAKPGCRTRVPTSLPANNRCCSSTAAASRR